MKQNIPIDDSHIRPAGVDNSTVEAVGKMTESLEKIERAKGVLYEFHQLIGAADITASEAADLLEKAGHHQHSDYIRNEIIGRNVLPGRWTFQIVEEFEETYYTPFHRSEETLRNELMDGKKHVYESEMKESNRTKNKSGHEARP